jgi:glucosamine-6-phosphate deaminase
VWGNDPISKKEVAMSQKRHSFPVEKLKVEIFPDRKAMGEAAGKAVADKMIEVLKEKKQLSMVFAAAPSQNEFLETLSQCPGLDWKKVTAFHMDEYVGLPPTAPQNFGVFLRERLFEKVRPGEVHYINGMAKDPQSECDRYIALLMNHPFDIACVGIGENGHLAFNDPPVADFNDPRLVKVVELELVSRRQQVHDGCFESLAVVPEKAITLTIPALFRAKSIYCMVPAPTKSEAVKKTLKDPVSTACPATVLRRHQNATLFLDQDSARLIDIDR